MTNRTVSWKFVDISLGPSLGAGAGSFVSSSDRASLLLNRDSKGGQLLQATNWDSLFFRFSRSCRVCFGKRIKIQFCTTIGCTNVYLTLSRPLFCFSYLRVQPEKEYLVELFRAAIKQQQASHYEETSRAMKCLRYLNSSFDFSLSLVLPKWHN